MSEFCVCARVCVCVYASLSTSACAGTLVVLRVPARYVYPYARACCALSLSKGAADPSFYQLCGSKKHSEVHFTPACEEFSQSCGVTENNEL